MATRLCECVEKQLWGCSKIENMSMDLQVAGKMPRRVAHYGLDQFLTLKLKISRRFSLLRFLPSPISINAFSHYASNKSILYLISSHYTRSYNSAHFLRCIVKHKLYSLASLTQQSLQQQLNRSHVRKSHRPVLRRRRLCSESRKFRGRLLVCAIDRLTRSCRVTLPATTLSNTPA